MFNLQQLRFFAVLAASLFTFHPFASAAQTSNQDQRAILHDNFRIAGTVTSASTHPLARARVVIVNTRNPQELQSLVTGEDGRFKFVVGAGKYSLQAAKRGFITGSYNQHEQFSTAIVTGAGIDTENLVLRLSPAAVLVGKIIDEIGEPVRNASITVYRDDHRSGISRIQQFRNASTDDQGTYEVTPLDGGTYFVSVNAKPWYAVHPVSSQASTGTLPSDVDHSLDVAYPITYYGDATEAEDATPIPIRGGDHVEADIHLSPVPALHLLFRVPGNGTTGFPQPQLQKSAFDGTDVVQPDGIQMVSPGVYEITGIAAGRYSVRTSGSANGGMTESMEVDLTTNNQELDVSTGGLTSTVKATVKLLGGLRLPAQLVVALRNSKGRIVAGAGVDAKGEVDFQNVSPGTYDFLAGSQSKAYSIVRISSQSSETSGHALNVPSGSSLKLSLSLVGGAVTVEGFAQRAGKGMAGAMVVLVPKDPKLNDELFRRDQSDLDGSFSIRSVIPGSYTIVAIENGWDLDWAKPAVIERYCLHGQTVVVGNQMTGSMQLPHPIDVLSRR